MPAIWVTGGPLVGIEAEFTRGAVVAIRSPFLVGWEALAAARGWGGRQ